MKIKKSRSAADALLEVIEFLKKSRMIVTTVVDEYDANGMVSRENMDVLRTLVGEE
jgi:CBS domain containing-hemolysin-like protein